MKFLKKIKHFCIFIYRFSLKYGKKILRKLGLLNYWDFFFILLITRQKYNHLPSSLEGFYIVTTKNTFYKISTKYNSFFIYDNDSIIKIRKKYPDISSIIYQYSFKKYFFSELIIMKSKKMDIIADDKEAIFFAKKILLRFRKYGKLDKISVDELFYLKEGLKILKKIISNQKFEQVHQYISDFFERNLFHIGPSHGDFHSKNILKENNKYYVIDFDCFREKSIQEFDAVYFIVQLITIKNNITWFEALHKLLDKDYSNEEYNSFLNSLIFTENFNVLALVFFIDRIGQEKKYLTGRGKLPLDYINQTVKFLLGNN